MLFILFAIAPFLLCLQSLLGMLGRGGKHCSLFPHKHSFPQLPGLWLADHWVFPQVLSSTEKTRYLSCLGPFLRTLPMGFPEPFVATFPSAWCCSPHSLTSIIPDCNAPRTPCTKIYRLDFISWGPELLLWVLAHTSCPHSSSLTHLKLYSLVSCFIHSLMLD